MKIFFNFWFWAVIVAIVVFLVFFVFSDEIFGYLLDKLLGQLGLPSNSD